MTDFHVDLKGKSAFITGAGKGVGRAIALNLAKSGANIFAVDINPDSVESLVQEIIEAGGTAIAWHGDVANKLLVGPAIEAMRDAYGSIDIVVNAAGVNKQSTFEKLDEWDWRRVLDVNLSGTFFVNQLAGRVMKDEGGGIIVNLASTAGHPSPRPNSVPYVASKAGIIGLTKVAAQELAPFGVRINAICHGNIDTEDEFPEYAQLDRIPQGRLGSPDEVATVVLFLCSSAASFITGQAIHVDGGESML